MATVTGRIFSEGWDILQIVLVPYLVEVVADNWGLVKRNDALFAAALTNPKIPVSPEDVADRLSALIVEEVVIPYEAVGQEYLAIVNVQDYQQRKYFSKRGPSCPIPPLQVFRRLSVKTQATFRHCADKFPETSPIAVAVAVAVAVADAVAVAGTTSEASCNFCAKPTKGPLQWYHDEARRVLGHCLLIDPPVCAKLIAKRTPRYGIEKLHAAFAVYLASEDPFVIKCGYSLQTFCEEKMLNGVMHALETGSKHGAGRRPGASSGGTPRRQPPAKPEDFKQTGRVEL
jgi:hypothetical protein